MTDNTIDVRRRNPLVKTITFHLARQLGKTEAARIAALNAAYGKAYESAHSPGRVLLEELRRRGFELVRR